MPEIQKKVPEKKIPEKKIPEKKVPEKKVALPKKEDVPPTKGTFRKIFELHVLLSENYSSCCFYFCSLNLCIYFVFLKDKYLKKGALSGRTVHEEKITVAFHKEEVVKERAELELVEAQVEELFEEEEFHEVQEYFEEEEFHEVEEFIKVEEHRYQEVHKVEEVQKVIGFLESEEVEVYEKPKTRPKGIGNSVDITNCYTCSNLLKYILCLV